MCIIIHLGQLILKQHKLIILFTVHVIELTYNLLWSIIIMHRGAKYTESCGVWRIYYSRAAFILHNIIQHSMLDANNINLNLRQCIYLSKNTRYMHCIHLMVYSMHNFNLV